jgi:hypothetical protein
MQFGWGERNAYGKSERRLLGRQIDHEVVLIV